MDNTHVFVHKDTHSPEVCSAQWQPCHSNRLVFTGFEAVDTRHQDSELPHTATLFEPPEKSCLHFTSDAGSETLLGTVCSLVACTI